MNDPNSAIPDHVRPAVWERYEAWRVRRYEKSQARNAHRFTGLRTRVGARMLVVGMVVSLGLTIVASVLAFLAPRWFFIPFVIGIVGTIAFLKVLGIVSGNIAEAPVSALDELQLAKRNSARSLGYLVVFTLMFVPYLALIALGIARDSISGQTVYGLGIVLISLLLTGTCTPSMLVAWWFEDPDPEDFVTDPATTTVPADDDAATSAAGDGPDGPGATRTDTSAHLDPPAPAPW